MNNDAIFALLFIAIVYIIGQIIYIIDHREKSKIQRIINEQYLPALINLSNKLTEEIHFRYPRLEFSPPNLEEFQKELSMQSVRLGPIYTPILIRAMNPFFKALGIAFENKSIPLRIGPEIIKDLVPPEFWANEINSRSTAYGQNPKDWNERRIVVHARDGACCVRCGVHIEIDQAHIHHLRRRSDGGNHAIENLVTLCPSCHTMMEGHESMRAVRNYIIARSGVIHVQSCRTAQRGRRILGMYPSLRSRGYKACKRCRPWEQHEKALSGWECEHVHFARTRSITLIRQLETTGILLTVPS